MVQKALLILGMSLVLMIGGGLWLQNKSVPQEPLTGTMTEKQIIDTYGPLIPIYFGHVQMRASVADTSSLREQGLSDTPSLPIGIVKLFVFDEPVVAPFWMKDMQYPIDILWLDADKKIIFIAANLSPLTYPTTFGPTEPSLYVIETPAGMAQREHMYVGSSFVW